MPRYAAFVALDSGAGEYREIEDLVDAPDPRAAAQYVIASDASPAGSRPLILVIEERAAALFTADHLGRAITTDEDLRHAIEEERGRPQLHVLPGTESAATD
jgi:hypothetical protein